MRCALLVLIVVLAGCAGARPTGVPAQCNPMCFQACVGKDGDTGVRVAEPGDSPQAWDEIGGQVTNVLATKLRTCDARREACAQCLQRLDKGGAIKL